MRVIFLGLFLVLSLTSCSKVGILSRFADTLIWWEVNDLVSFTSAHKEAARNEVASIYKEASFKMIPILAESLTEFSGELESGQKIEEMASVKKVLKAAMNLPIQLEPHIANLSALIGPQEFNNLLLSYQKKIENEEKARSEQESREREQSRCEDLLETFLGSLNNDQEELLNTFYKVESYPVDLMFKNKRHNLDLLKATGGSHPQMQNLAMQFFNSSFPLELPAYKAAREAYLQKWLGLLNSILAKRSPEQSTRMQKKLLSLSQDIRALEDNFKHP